MIRYRRLAIHFAPSAPQQTVEIPVADQELGVLVWSRQADGSLVLETLAVDTPDLAKALGLLLRLADDGLAPEEAVEITICVKDVAIAFTASGTGAQPQPALAPTAQE